MKGVNRYFLHIVLIWGLIALPVPPQIFAAEPEPDISTVIEMSDCSAFCKDLKDLPAFKGYSSDEMKEFWNPVQAQIDSSLKVMKDRFGVDIKALSTLLSGRVLVRLNTKEKVFLVFAEPGEKVDISANIAVLKKVFEQNRVKFAERTVTGVTVLTVKQHGAVLSFIYNDSKFVFGVSNIDNSVKLISDYLMGDVAPFNSGLDMLAAYPDVKGKGLSVFSDTGVPDLPVPGMNVKAMFEAANIPGFAPSASRMYVKMGRICSAAFSKQDMKKGLSSMLLPGPVSEETLSWAHESCITAAGFHVQLDTFPQIAADVISASGSQELIQNYNMVLPQVKMMTGLDLEKDLFGSLGNEILILSLPSRAGGGFPVLSLIGLNSLVGVIKLKDPAVFQKTSQIISMLLAQAAQMDRIGGGLRSVEHNGTQIQYIKAFGGVLSPCFAVKDGYLLLGLNVPIMRYLLDSRGKGNFTQTDEFRLTTQETGASLSSIFVYQKGISEAEGRIGQNFTNPLIGVWISSVFASALLPVLGRAREEGRRVSCMNNLKQIATACAMYSMSHNENYPEKLSDLMPDQISDRMLFQCKSAPFSANSYVYLPGVNANSPSNAILVFDHAGNHADGRNVAFVDAHVSFMPEHQFKAQLRRMLEPRFRNSYTPEALKTIELVLNDQLSPPAGTPAPAAFKKDPLFDKNEWRNFIRSEGIKIASSVDFALFPRGEIFPGQRKSNITSVMVKDDGIYSRSFSGHMIRPGNGASTLPVYIAVTAIIAAIAIPSLIKSKISANEGAAAGTLKTLNGMFATYKKKGYAGLGRLYPIGNDPDVLNSGKFCGLYYEVNNAEDQVTLIGRAEAAADWRSSDDPSSPTGTYTPCINIQEYITLKEVQFERRPKMGYWFALMKYCDDGQGNRYTYDKANARNHYGLVAWPAEYGSSGELTFIINEEGTVYSMDRGPETGYLDTYPGPTPSALGWEIAE